MCEVEISIGDMDIAHITLGYRVPRQVFSF